MATKKTKTGAGKKLSMVGCGTMEQMFKSRARERFSKIDGVVGIQVLKDKIVLRVVSDEVAAKLPKSFERRPVETIVTGTISKQAVKK